MEFIIDNWEVFGALFIGAVAFVAAVFAAGAQLVRSAQRSVEAQTTQMISIFEQLQERSKNEAQEQQERRELEVRHINQSFELQKQVHATNAALGESKLQVAKLSQQVEALANRAQIAEAEQQRTQDRLDVERSEYSERLDKIVSVFESNMTQAQNNIKAKESQIIQLTHDLEATRLKVAALETTVRDLTDKLDEIQQTADARQDRIAQLQAERDAAIAERDEALNKQTELYARIEELETRVQELENKYESSNNQEAA